MPNDKFPKQRYYALRYRSINWGRNAVNFNRIDLNLFAVLDAIYTAGSLTKASEVLCITQPAVSNSLSRLREMLNDPLFVRIGHTMTPTPVAKNIIGPAREALNTLRKCVQESQIFGPSTANNTYNFAARDLMESSVLPRLVERLQSLAPNISLTNYDLPKSEVVSSMSSGVLDFYVDIADFHDALLCRKLIATDRFVMVARKDHPSLVAGVTLDIFLQLGHINVSQRNSGPGVIEAALHKLGHQRKIIMEGGNYLTVPSTIVRTDLVACLPFHLAKHYDLVTYELPFDLHDIEYFLYWHLSADLDPAHIWLREQIAEVVKTYN